MKPDARNRIPVGRNLYDLSFSATPIIDDDKQECAMRIDYKGKRIIISDRVPQHLRPQMVGIAVNEIWKNCQVAGRAVRNG